MITEHDLQEAIAECLGKRNPDAGTCIKLAAFYTIRDYLYPKEEVETIPRYSFSPDPSTIGEVTYESDTDFSRLIHGKKSDDVWRLVDELMSTISVLNPRLYDSVLQRIREM